MSDLIYPLSGVAILAAGIWLGWAIRSRAARDAENFVRRMAGFVDPFLCSSLDDELEVFADEIRAAKAIARERKWPVAPDAIDAE